MRAPGLLLLTGVLSMMSPAGYSKSNKNEASCSSLSQADVINVIADYDVKHVGIAPIQYSGVQLNLYGSTAHSLRSIMINDAYEAPIRKLTLLHELYHVRQLAEKKKNDEGTVMQCAGAKYREIFGGDLDLPEAMRK